MLCGVCANAFTLFVNINFINVKITFKKDSYRRQSGTSKTANRGCFDRFPCTVSPLQYSRILLTRSGGTVYGNLSKRLIFAVLDVPVCCLLLSFLNVIFTFIFDVFIHLDHIYGCLKTTTATLQTYKVVLSQ